MKKVIFQWLICMVTGIVFITSCNPDESTPKEKDPKTHKDSLEVQKDTARVDNSNRKVNPGAYGMDK